MPRRNIYVSAALDRMISRHPDINLSRVLQRAITQEIAKLEREPRSYTVSCNDSATAWMFVLATRDRGWTVAHPNTNGSDRWFVTVLDDNGEGWG